MAFWNDKLASRIRHLLGGKYRDDGLDASVLQPAAADALNYRTHTSIGGYVLGTVANGSSKVAWIPSYMTWDTTKGVATAQLTTNSQFVVPVDGTYLLLCRIQAAAAGGPTLQTTLRFYDSAGGTLSTHSTQLASSASGIGPTLTMTRYLTAGQMVAHYVYNSGGTIAANYEFSMTRLVPN